MGKRIDFIKNGLVFLFFFCIERCKINFFKAPLIFYKIFFVQIVQAFSKKNLLFGKISIAFFDAV